MVIVADSPFYRYEESSRQMQAERRAMFEKQFGICSDSNNSRDYLTASVLNELAERLAIQWNVSKPWYGLSWALRPLRARLLRRREPSKFYLWWFKVEK